MMTHFFRYFLLQRFQFAKFILVGLTTGSLYFLCFHFFYGILKLDYRIGVSIAYLITIASHFLLHRSFTFKANGQAMMHHLWKYLFMLLFNYINVLMITWFYVTLMKGSPYIGVIMATALTVAINFFMMKHFVFDINKAT